MHATLTQSATMPIADIVVGERRRKQVTNIDQLANSVQAIGLLQPIVVTRDRRLVAGARRLEAVKSLGWTDVAVHVVDSVEDAVSMVVAERDENTCREPFTPSEAYQIAKVIEELEKPKAKERKAEGKSKGGATAGKGRPKDSLRESSPKAKRDDSTRAESKAAESVGVSRKTYRKVKEVMQAADEKPEVFGDLVAKMDESGKVDAAHKAMKRRQEELDLERRAAEAKQVEVKYKLIQSDLAKADVAEGSIDWIITDPPYPKEHLDVYDSLAAFAERTLKPGGSLIAMVGQSYLPEVINRILAGGMSYQWTLAYMTPGGQATQLWQRKVNTFWKPLLWFVKGEYAGDWIGDVCQSRVNDNDKRFHHWGQSESGMRDIIERFTKPGDVVCDPFCGGGTTGVVAVGLDRQFIGIDIDKEHLRKAELRLKAEAA